MLTHLDLFSGIGGFTIAAQAAGFTTIGFSEIEPYACKILKRHWPNVPNYGDIRNVPQLNADLITGGPPCQPASCAGHQRGSEDHRWLWPQTLACVERIHPTFCNGWAQWQPEPELGRVADGIPNRTHRLKGLGNAIVPAVAEVILREMARLTINTGG